VDPIRCSTADSKPCVLTAVSESVEWNVLGAECMDPICSTQRGQAVNNSVY